MRHPTHTKARLVSLAWLPLLIVGCTNQLAFSTATRFGLDISQRADQQPEITLGYNRAEIASIPVAGKEEEVKDADDVHDAYSVLGTFYVYYGKPGEGLHLNQVFATGMAARKAAQNPKMQKAFGNSAGVVLKNQKEELPSTTTPQLKESATAIAR